MCIKRHTFQSNFICKFVSCGSVEGLDADDTHLYISCYHGRSIRQVDLLSTASEGRNKVIAGKFSHSSELGNGWDLDGCGLMRTDGNYTGTL